MTGGDRAARICGSGTGGGEICYLPPGHDGDHDPDAAALVWPAAAAVPDRAAPTEDDRCPVHVLGAPSEVATCSCPAAPTEGAGEALGRVIESLCDECGGAGYTTGSAHSDRCDGYNCGDECPVPVQEQCFAVAHEAAANVRAALAERDALRDRLAAAIKVGTGELLHIGNGWCPDMLEGFDSRDPECPACAALVPPSPGEPR